MRCTCPEGASRCTEALLSDWDGKLLNASAIGRRLGVSHTTAMRMVKDLAKRRVVCILPSFDSSRRPLLYVLDAPLGSWVGAVMKEIVKLSPESRFFWWKTRRVRQIHLVAQVGQRRLGFRFCLDGIPRRKDRIPLQIAQQRALIHGGYILHSCGRASFFRPMTVELSLMDFLFKPGYWINPPEPRAEVRRINTATDAMDARLFFGT